MLKVGIIGVGSMGTQHFLRLMNKIHGATVTAVSDINEAHAKEVIAPYPTVRFIADPIALINDPEVTLSLSFPSTPPTRNTALRLSSAASTSSARSRCPHLLRAQRRSLTRRSQAASA